MTTLADLYPDRSNYVQLQPGDQGYQAPTPAPAPAPTAPPNPAAQYEALKAQAPLSWWERLVNPSGAAEAYANKVQRFNLQQAGIDSQKNQDAQVEMNFAKGWENSEPGSPIRKALLDQWGRWSQAKGRPLDKALLDFMGKADADDVTAIKYVNQKMIPELFPGTPPEEVQRFLNGTLAGNSKLFSMIAQAKQHLAQTSKLEAETKEKNANAQMLEQAGKSLQNLSESPTEGPQATPSPQSTPLLPVQPGGSQGPSLQGTSASLPPFLSTPEGQNVQRFVVARANALGIDPALAQALIHQESGWDPQATSPTGVQGLAQVTNATGAAYGQTPQTRTNPYASANAGLTHLASLLQQHNGNVPQALMAYNGGSDPQYVQHVAAHMPLYGGTMPRPGTEAQAQANDQEKATLLYHKQQIDKLTRQLSAFSPAVLASPGAQRLTNLWQEQIKQHQAEIDRIEKRYDTNKPDASILMAGRKLGFMTPWQQWTPQQMQAAVAAAPSFQAEDKAQETEATAKASSRVRQEEEDRKLLTPEQNLAYGTPGGTTQGNVREKGDLQASEKLPEKQQDTLAGYATIYRLSGGLIEQLQDPDTLKTLEPVIGGMLSNPKAWYERFRARKVKGYTNDQQRFAAKLALQMLELRKTFIGTAQTAGETEAAEPFLTSLADATPENIMGKLEGIQDYAKLRHDITRQTAVDLHQRVPEALPELARAKLRLEVTPPAGTGGREPSAVPTQPPSGKAPNPMRQVIEEYYRQKGGR